MDRLNPDMLQKDEYDHIVRHLFDCRSVKWTALHCGTDRKLVYEIQVELSNHLPDPETLFLMPIQLRVDSLDLEPGNPDYEQNWKEFERMAKLAEPLLKNRAIIKAAELKAQQEVQTLHFSQLVAAQSPELYQPPQLVEGHADPD